jgi:hypothetical protein
LVILKKYIVITGVANFLKTKFLFFFCLSVTRVKKKTHTHKEIFESNKKLI